MRTAVGERGRARIMGAAYALGLRPRINQAAAHSVLYPEGRRAALVLSADLELAWAWRFARHVSEPLPLAREKARRGRRNLGGVLDLCDRYELPITWATVGHLFLDHCSRSNGPLHSDLPRIPYFENEHWVYRTGDWFDADPGSASLRDPEWPDWYGPDLVRSILQRPIQHEIACHSFSHVAFSDEHCPPEVAAGELFRCQQLAGSLGLRLRSLVFPGNLAGNYASVRSAGFTAYRWHGHYDLDVPQRDHLGLWRIPGGTCLDKPHASWTSGKYIQILRGYVDAAIDYGLAGGFWFHPETDTSDVDQVFPAIFEYIASRRADLWVVTMAELALWLDSQVRGLPGQTGDSRQATRRVAAPPFA